jgi:putative protease
MSHSHHEPPSSFPSEGQALGVEPQNRHLPELLAPAGDWECARAAVENGADAIYFGLEKFNARMRAKNFAEADLPKLMEFLHRRGVKGYVTFNTLVFENEMREAEQYARTIIAAGVDAAIVQDVGICRLLRRLSPDFPLHVSTQMTVTSAGGVRFARELGCNLVVLARECSLKELEKIQIAQSALGTLSNEKAEIPLPLEVFVHGALCVAYSGQCLTSEALGGRSANRGECAQACRMAYDLVSDGQLVPLGDRKYLLSPQDLAGLEVLPKLARLGVASLKIEGRLKSPEYVANITRVYRQALDQLARDPNASLPNPTYELEMAFSRGLYTGWFHGTNNQELVHARFGKKRGVYLGLVSEVLRDRVRVLLEGPLKPGDGVVFDAGKPEEKEEGGRVYEISNGRAGVNEPTKRNGHKSVVLSFGRGDIDWRRVHVGDKLWKTSDPELERRLRQSFEGERPRFHRPITGEVHGSAGQPLTLILRDELGHILRLESTMPLTAANTQPLTEEKLRQQLGRLGGTPFTLASVRSFLEGNVLLPVSELNRMRRQAVAELEAQRAKPLRWTIPEEISPADVGRSADIPVRSKAGSMASCANLIVLVRNLTQLDAALSCGVDTLYCEFEDPKKYRDAVARVRVAAGVSPAGRDASSVPVGKASHKPSIWVTPPRIFKMGEEWMLKQVRSCEADGYLVRNYDHLAFFDGDRRIGDYSLNIANRLSADYFKNKYGLERVTASYDLNFTQLEALLDSAPPEWFEVTIHQHMPMFHMEHCVFCAFLSSGTDYTNCGRPCDKHDLKLRDRVGAEHPIKADVGCRNTVFNALAQTGAEYVGRLQALGATHFRLEFLNETADQVVQTIGKYRQLLAGKITGAQLWRELKLFNQLGVTRGQMAGR